MTETPPQALLLTAVNAGNVLDSDVRQDTNICPDAVPVRVENQAKNPNAPDSAFDDIVVERYEVRYFRSDGRGTQGVDVPFTISGNVAFIVPAGTAANLNLEVVRRQAKVEPPLSNIVQGRRAQRDHHVRGYHAPRPDHDGSGHEPRQRAAADRLRRLRQRSGRHRLPDQLKKRAFMRFPSVGHDPAAALARLGGHRPHPGHERLWSRRSQRSCPGGTQRNGHLDPDAGQSGHDQRRRGQPVGGADHGSRPERTARRGGRSP